MPDMILTPVSGRKENEYSDKATQFGCYETQHMRPSQEDALIYHTFLPTALTGSPCFPLTPKDIGHRLWTTCQILDKPDFETCGTTASITVYDGRGHLITATLADSSVFAVIYDRMGEVLSVTRLNSRVHSVYDREEQERIDRVGSWIEESDMPRVGGVLAVTRAIGDWKLGAFRDEKVICSDADLDITDLSQLSAHLTTNPQTVGSMQIISTCDGFTDGAGLCAQSKRGHERYLLHILKDRIQSPGIQSEVALAKELANIAIKDGSTDNISIAIKSLYSYTGPFLMGIFDGHGGSAASQYVARHFHEVFMRQCLLSQDQYSDQYLSVTNNRESYQRDNAVIENRPDTPQQTRSAKMLLFEQQKFVALLELEERNTLQSIIRAHWKKTRIHNMQTGFKGFFSKTTEEIVYRQLQMLDKKEEQCKTEKVIEKIRLINRYIHEHPQQPFAKALLTVLMGHDGACFSTSPVQAILRIESSSSMVSL